MYSPEIPTKTDKGPHFYILLYKHFHFLSIIEIFHCQHQCLKMSMLIENFYFKLFTSLIGKQLKLKICGTIKDQNCQSNPEGGKKQNKTKQQEA